MNDQKMAKKLMDPELDYGDATAGQEMAGLLGFEPKSGAPQALRISKLPHKPGD